MQTQDRLVTLTQQAERMLQAQLGRRVILHDAALISARERSLVVRCAVTGWDDVTSVVLKRNEGDDARGFTDWASLAFLSTVQEAVDIAPRFYAGDAQERLFVMEDLGGSRSLADVLDGGTAEMVLHVLRALATTMARFVVATTDREGVYARMRAALPGAAELGRQREATRWLEARQKVARWAEALAIPLPRGFDAAYEQIATLYAEPGAYLAFSHGDPAPSNNHIAAGRVRLVDFEYAGYRHALYDITAWAILCPLPWEWVHTMERVFRGILDASPVSGALSGDERYREEWTAMCAYRALAMITWFSPDLLAQDAPWTAGWTRRAALISTTLRLQRVSAGSATCEPLAELGGKMAVALQTRWPQLGDGAIPWPGVVDAP